MNEEAAGVSSDALNAIAAANKQKFTIDDENWVDLGEATFHIGDIKSLMKGVMQPNPQTQPMPAIIFGVMGSQLNLQLPLQQRDIIYDEIKKRMILIKNNKIHIYMSNLKREKEKQEKEMAKQVDAIVEEAAVTLELGAA